MDAVKKDKNFFDEFGLEVAQGQVEIGKTYPLFGMITKFLDETPGQVKIEINYGISAQLNVADSSKIELLKQRAFESGIFVSKIIAKEPTVEVECLTVIFGRQQSFNA